MKKVNLMKQVLLCSSVLMLAAMGGTVSAQQRQMPEPFGLLSMPEKKPDQRLFWLHDIQNGKYSRAVLYDADTGRWVASTDTGWEGVKMLSPKDGKHLYSVDMYLARGYRGERTDVVNIRDAKSLKPVREIVVPPKRIAGFSDPNYYHLTDDDAFVIAQFFTPASTIGVADMRSEKFVGEIETGGCAHVMPAGKRRFFTLCGDSSVLEVVLDEQGKEASRQRYAGVFDADKDPLHGSGMRLGNTWYFPSYNGQIYTIDVSGPKLRFGKPWQVSATEGGKIWVPGPGMQPIFLHEKKRQLYVLMHPKEGLSYHREPGTEVWVFDVDSRKRLKRIALASPAYAVAVSQDDDPLIYASSFADLGVGVYSASGQRLRTITMPPGSMPTLIQPYE